MAEQGQVLSVDGENVIVRMQRSEACAKCGACIAGLTSKEMMIRALNVCDAGENDWVNIELEGNSFLKAVLIMYGIPFVGMFAGFIAGWYITRSMFPQINAEIAGFLSGLFLMLLSFFFIKKREGKWNETKYTPIATEKVEVVKQ